MNNPANFPVKDTDNDLFRRIDQAVQVTKMDDEWRRSHMTLQLYRRDAVLEGEERGRMEGRMEGKVETAKRMLMKKMAVDDIAECTGISIAEVNRLKLAVEPN